MQEAVLGNMRPRGEKVLSPGIGGLDAAVLGANTDSDTPRFQLPFDISVLGAHPGWRSDKLYARR